MITGLVIFVVTYILISARRLGWLGLDRPTVALLGAVACVAGGVLSPAAALEAVEGNTIVLLFGMMGLGAFLAADGFFDRAAEAIARRARTPGRLLAWLVWGAGILSALITNDAVCVLGAPLVCGIIRRRGLPPLPFLLALATAANTGSAATLVGNPQHMLCASLGGLAYRDYLLAAGPAAVLALAFNHAVLYFAFRRTLRRAAWDITAEGEARPVLLPSTKIMLTVLIGTVAVYIAGGNLAWTAVGGLALVFLAARAMAASEIWSRIDWSVLVFFAALFIVVEGFVRTGLPAAFFTAAPFTALTGFGGWLGLSGIFLIGSNIVSNVPFILVVREAMTALPNAAMSWELLAVTSTFAGNLTLLGSVANIIVAEKSREFGVLGFWSHLKIGAPVAVGSTLIGAGWIFLAHRWWF